MGKILDQAREVIKRIEENDQSPTVRITATAAAKPLPVTSSKFGGVPYLPAGVDAPANKEGQPLGMIAQINCAELPQNTIYPESGMLQFWIDPGDEEALWGMDDTIADRTQNGYRVIYYPELGEPNPDARAAKANWDDYGWPISPETVEYALSFEAALGDKWSLMNETAEALFVDTWNELYPETPIEDFFDEIDELGEDRVTDTIDRETEDQLTHKIGGEPIFTQNDPRDFADDLRDYTVNLLTMISVSDGSWADPNTPAIMWGDVGTANWLITPEQLKNRDFSQVIFEWSCC